MEVYNTLAKCYRELALSNLTNFIDQGALLVKKTLFFQETGLKSGQESEGGETKKDIQKFRYYIKSIRKSNLKEKQTSVVSVDFAIYF